MLKSHNWHICPILLTWRPEGCFPWAKWFLAPSGALCPIPPLTNCLSRTPFLPFPHFLQLPQNFKGNFPAWGPPADLLKREELRLSQSEEHPRVSCICLSQVQPSRLTATDALNMLQLGDYPVSRGREEEAKQKNEPHPKARLSKPWVNSG